MQNLYQNSVESQSSTVNIQSILVLSIRVTRCCCLEPEPVESQNCRYRNQSMTVIRNQNLFEQFQSSYRPVDSHPVLDVTVDMSYLLPVDTARLSYPVDTGSVDSSRRCCIDDCRPVRAWLCRYAVLTTSVLLKPGVIDTPSSGTGARNLSIA